MHDALHAFCDAGEFVLPEHVHIRVVGVIELFAARGEPLLHIFKLDIAFCGQEERKDHASKRGVNARVIHAEPQDEPHHDVPARTIDLQVVHNPEDHTAECRRSKPRDARRLSVKQRDHDDAEQIVRDGERREEHLGGGCHLIARERHDAERKCDVGGDGHCPAVHCSAHVEHGVDNRGRGDAAACGENRHHGLARVGEHAGGEFVFKLDANAQKEDGHQKIVNEPLEGDLPHVWTNLNGEWRLQEGVHGEERIGVGDDDRSDGCEHHDCGGNRSVVEKALVGRSARRALGDRGNRNDIRWRARRAFSRGVRWSGLRHDKYSFHLRGGRRIVVARMQGRHRVSLKMGRKQSSPRMGAWER